MNDHISTVKIVCKPHVAVYLNSALSNQDGLIYLTEKGVFWTIIKDAITADPLQRLTDIPKQYNYINVVLPRNYRNYFTDRNNVSKSVINTEEIFWTETVKFISQQRAAYMQTKEEAIAQYYKRFNITESIYPVDHFRRQLLRKGVAVDVKKFESYKICYKLPDSISRKIAETYERGLASCRQLAKTYNINHQTVINIHKKVYKKTLQA